MCRDIWGRFVIDIIEIKSGRLEETHFRISMYLYEKLPSIAYTSPSDTYQRSFRLRR